MILVGVAIQATAVVILGSCYIACCFVTLIE